MVSQHVLSNPRFELAGSVHLSNGPWKISDQYHLKIQVSHLCHVSASMFLEFTLE
jgi:hypothetical protein